MSNSTTPSRLGLEPHHPLRLPSLEDALTSTIALRLRNCLRISHLRVSQTPLSSNSFVQSEYNGPLGDALRSALLPPSPSYIPRSRLSSSNPRPAEGPLPPRLPPLPFPYLTVCPPWP